MTAVPFVRGSCFATFAANTSHAFTSNCLTAHLKSFAPSFLPGTSAVDTPVSGKDYRELQMKKKRDLLTPFSSNGAMVAACWLAQIAVKNQELARVATIGCLYFTKYCRMNECS